MKLLARFFSRVVSHAGALVYDLNQPATQVFFVERGVVQLLLPGTSKKNDIHYVNSPHASEITREDSDQNFRQVKKISVGGIFGDVSFFLSSDYK